MAGYHALAGANIIALDTAQGILPPGAFDVAIRNGIGPNPSSASPDPSHGGGNPRSRAYQPPCATDMDEPLK